MCEIVISNDLVDYTVAVEHMQKTIAAIRKENAPEQVWFLEHPPLFTLGTSATQQDILSNTLPVYESQRGGKVTYHGPGQLIAYVMLDLKKRNMDIHQYVRLLENWIIETLKVCSLKSITKKGRVGVWVEDTISERKIAAIGVRITHGITWHGLSINVNPNMEHYQAIVACGLKNFSTTSLLLEGIQKTVDQVRAIMIKKGKDLKIFP